jgi:diguanylate cyclase (GGDEF)-like protein
MPSLPRSLRARLTLALLVTGLLSAVLVGFITRYFTAQDAIGYAVLAIGGVALVIFSNMLAGAFHRMSSDLAAAHAALQESHDTIRAQAEQLKELSIRDEMTGLHNRRYFNEQAELVFAHVRRYGRTLTVMIADIDHFKQVNDRFSHTMGDVVLRRVAKILASNTRDTDVVARYGGEEFVVAFTETPLEAARATCERIRRSIETYPWQELHPDLHLTITMGVDDDVSRGSVDAMLAAADTRLYEGKQRGRNQVCAGDVVGT